MKTRNVVIHTGERFEVPQGIQRIDHRSTHGWQLRYGGTRLYSDGSRGAQAALEAARKELSELLGTKVHLFLHVKVDEKWGDDKEIYEELGLEWVR